MTGKSSPFLLQLIAICLFFYSSGCSQIVDTSSETNRPKLNLEALRKKAVLANEYCKKQHYNSDFCLLVDMGLHSGIKRFFVWDFKADTIKYSFLVGHGCCNNIWSKDYSKDDPKFSNIDGSHCSSLGKYRIGIRAASEWGVKVKYVLQGLEATNNNAQKRFIVLHSWELVSDEEIYPRGTPEGWGCPTLSNNSFKQLDPLLSSSKKPVLLWIYVE